MECHDQLALPLPPLPESTPLPTQPPPEVLAVMAALLLQVVVAETADAAKGGRREPAR